MIETPPASQYRTVQYSTVTTVLYTCRKWWGSGRLVGAYVEYQHPVRNTQVVSSPPPSAVNAVPVPCRLPGFSVLKPGQARQGTPGHAEKERTGFSTEQDFMRSASFLSLFFQSPLNSIHSLSIHPSNFFYYSSSLQFSWSTSKP